MADPFIGEIRIFAGNFAPVGWSFCNGSSLDISQNDALFALIGTTYGGDGQTHFNLPDLRGAVPMHVGNNHVLGETSGSETVTITANTMPVHSHGFMANTAVGTQGSPAGTVVAQSPQVKLYIEDGQDAGLGNVLSMYGGSQPHDNMMPYICINYIIALQGIFPQQN